MKIFDEILLDPETPRNDNLPILRERLADGAERFLDRGVDEAAGIDDDEVGARVSGRSRVALGAKLREDALGIDQRFRTTEGDETDFGVLTAFQGRSCSAARA